MFSENAKALKAENTRRRAGFPCGALQTDLAALEENYRILRRQAGDNCAVSGIVKANAYGAGADRIAPLLAEAGCSLFFVADPGEAVALRNLPGMRDKDIAVFGGALPGTEEFFEEHDLIPVMNAFDDLRNWRQKPGSRIFLHFDTAMNRLGMSAAEIESLLNDRALKNKFHIDMVLSHFASADEADDGGLTERQYARFSVMALEFPEARKSLANSAGLFRDKKYALDLARPGIALYGGNPVHGKNPMKPVVSLSVPVLQVRHVKKGDSVGYGAAHVFAEDRVMATLGLGYADGFMRALSGKGKLYWNGEPCPVLGRVSMDLTSVDITDLSNRPKPGDYLEVIGPSQSIDDLAQDAGTISYEILTGLGQRFERSYIS